MALNSTKPISRNLSAAQAAFATRSAEGLKSSHSAPPHKQPGIYEPAHKSLITRELVKALGRPVISGATYSVFVVGLMASMFFAGEQNLYFFTLTTSIFGITGAVFIGSQDYLNQTYERQLYQWERQRESWEYDNYLEGEQREMIELYQERGMSRDDAELTIRTVSKYKELFVDIMMLQELGLLQPEFSPLQHALGMAAAFFCGVLVPLLPALVCCVRAECDVPFAAGLFQYVVMLCVAVLSCIGFLRSHCLDGNRWLRPVLLKVANFLLACAFAYLVSRHCREHWKVAS